MQQQNKPITQRRSFQPREWIAFNRYELAGSFGDIGTDLPLLADAILATRLDPASVLICFGAAQVFSGCRSVMDPAD